VDPGPNNLINFPVITSATYNGASTTISGTLDAAGTLPFSIDVYGNSAADSSGNGEGLTYLGSTSTSGSSWTFVMSGAPTYAILTATTTDAAPHRQHLRVLGGVRQRYRRRRLGQQRRQL
jgi:hypothetical protein